MTFINIIASPYTFAQSQCSRVIRQEVGSARRVEVSLFPSRLRGLTYYAVIAATLLKTMKTELQISVNKTRGGENDGGRERR